MIHQCKDYPGTKVVEQFLYHYMRQTDVQDTEDDEDSDEFDAAFEIQVLSTSAIKCQGDFRIFQFASAISQQKNC